jgi:IS30 family transposase
MQILTYMDRTRIEFYLSVNQKPAQIAKYLKRSKSVISRELARNSRKNKPYSASFAQTSSIARKATKQFKKLSKDVVLRDYVITQIRAGFAPDAISGRLANFPKLAPTEVQGKTISHEAIYQYIYSELSKPLKLWRHLPKHHSKRKLRGNRSQYKPSSVPNRISIHNRPEIVNLRQRYGDWETDSVIGSGGSILSVQKERVLQFTKIHRIRDKTAESTLEALCSTIDSMPLELSKTFTFDNGTENFQHQRLQDWYLIKTYFCDPYKSWQKGSVENINGMIRRFFPKKTNFDLLTDEQIQTVEDWLNNYPRKKLGYKTPNEALHQAMVEMGLT